MSIIKTNEKLMIKLRNNLDVEFFKILGFDPEFKFNKSKVKEDFKFDIMVRSQKEKSKYRVEFKFSVIYEHYKETLRRYKKTNGITVIPNNKIDNIIERFSDIKYVKIDALYITPKNTGLGTKLMNSFLKEISKIEKLDMIYLHPQDENARRFWEKIGFSNIDDTRKPIGLGFYEMFFKIVTSK